MKAIIFYLFSVTCGLIFVSEVHGYIGFIQHNPESNSTSHCFTDDLGPMDIHETKRLKGECAIATCLTDRGIKITGCGLVGVNPPCYILPGDIRKPFPVCCYEVKCEDQKPKPSKNVV